ncbi:hypothetical protein QFC20_000060 [Naganishia adeliensis]|uniref:Uncharacterized protein n=1 Tax=Naganishia adeliensis TaxID=92952 RepID=A0ACC2X314_9TREE|nr:hypothetical protein QFC20_000060 [Naganishia adeliensis]
MSPPEWTPPLATYVPIEEQAEEDLEWMKVALDQAEEALAAKEVPVGCVFVKDGVAIAKARNRTNEWRNVSFVGSFPKRRDPKNISACVSGNAPRRTGVSRSDSENAPSAASRCDSLRYCRTGMKGLEVAGAYWT